VRAEREVGKACRTGSGRAPCGTPSPPPFQPAPAPGASSPLATFLFEFAGHSRNVLCVWCCTFRGLSPNRGRSHATVHPPTLGLTPGSTRCDESSRGRGRLSVATTILELMTSGAHAQFTVVHLHPDGVSESIAFAGAGGQQVGQVRLIDTGSLHASLWTGTADSWVDLHAFLPAEFLTSTARSIWSDGSFIYIAGNGYSTLTNREEALLWSVPVPAPSAMALLSLGGLCAARRRRCAWR